jgi:hypothetical protein
MCVVMSADMSCQGQVVYTGGSSLDICMEAQQVGHELDIVSGFAALSRLMLHACGLVWMVRRHDVCCAVS